MHRLLIESDPKKIDWLGFGKCTQTHRSPPTAQGIYDWFSEGLDTLDLKEARALLQKLQ
jgi:hypothetical protein